VPWTLCILFYMSRYLSLISQLIYDGIAKMFHLTVRFRSGIRYARVQTYFAGSVCTQCIWSLWPNIRFLPSIVSEKNVTKNVHIQYSQRHTMINHCDRRITHLSDNDIYFVLFNIPSTFLLYLECYLLSPKMHKKVSK
jgi:hypothetical protein